MINKEDIIKTLKKLRWEEENGAFEFGVVKFIINDGSINVTNDITGIVIPYNELINDTQHYISYIDSTFNLKTWPFSNFIKDLVEIIKDDYKKLIPKPQNEIPERYQTESGKNFMDILKNEMLTHDEYIGFLKGNVYKYVFRYQKKNGKEDLEKAQTYLKLLEDEINE